MSQLFVHWTLHSGDVNGFQSKTKDKHVDQIYTYDIVIAGTGVEFREIGCYPFNFHSFTFFAILRYFMFCCHFSFQTCVLFCYMFL